MRLKNGGSQYEGRVEFCFHEEWGTVCDESFGSLEASVVCQSQGYLWKGLLALVNAQSKNCLVASLLDCYCMQERNLLEEQHLAKEKTPFTLMVSNAQEKSHLSRIVHTVHSIILMVVHIHRMLVWCVKVN